MNTLWSFFTHHWISICSVAGSILAIAYVYKNKDKLLLDNDEK